MQMATRALALLPRGATRRAPVASAPAPLFLALLLLLLLLLAWAAPLAGQDSSAALDESRGEWAVVDRVEHGTVSLDTSSIVPLGNGIVRVRTRWQFAQVQHDARGEAYRSSVAVRAIHCQRGEMALIAFADHDGGRTVGVSTQPLYAAEWDRVNPQSISERIARLACSLGTRQVKLAQGTLSSRG